MNQDERNCVFTRARTLGMWWLNNLHRYLHQYNVLEIFVLFILLYMFNVHAEFLMQNYTTMNEWQMVAMAQFPLAIWAMIGTVWKSINTDLPPAPPTNTESTDS